MSNINELQGVELTTDLMEQLFNQLKGQQLSMRQLRIVTGTNDKTVARIDRSSREGNTMRDTFDSLL